MKKQEQKGKPANIHSSNSTITLRLASGKDAIFTISAIDGTAQLVKFGSQSLPPKPNPERSIILCNESTTKVIQGHITEAEDDIIKAIWLWDGNSDAFNLLGRMIWTDNPAIAISMLNTAIKLNKDRDGFYLNRAQARLHTCDFQGASEDYNMGVQLSPLNIEAYKKRADFYNWIGAFANQLQDLQTVQKLAKAQGGTVVGLEKMIKDCHVALSEREKSSASSHSTSSSKAAGGFSKKYLDSELREQLAKQYSELANVMLAINNPEQVEGALTKAIELDSSNANYPYNRGHFRYTQKRYEEAALDFRKARRLDPEGRDILRMQISVELDRNNTKEAIEMAEGALSSKSLKIEGYSLLTAIYLKQNDYPKAIEMNDKAVTLIKREGSQKLYPQVYINRSTIYMQFGQYEHALQGYKAIYKLVKEDLSCVGNDERILAEIVDNIKVCEGELSKEASRAKLPVKQPAISELTRNVYSSENVASKPLPELLQKSAVTSSAVSLLLAGQAQNQAVSQPAAVEVVMPSVISSASKAKGEKESNRAAARSFSVQDSMVDSSDSEAHVARHLLRQKQGNKGHKASK